VRRKTRRFYKFFPKERSGFFGDRCVRFTPPAAFNDPFDMAPVLDSAFGEPGAGGPFAALKERMHELGQTLADNLVNRTRYPQTFMSKIYGVLSLTMNNRTLLMWAHYASEHQGFAVEFDADHPWFNQKIAARDFGEVGTAREVRYSKFRPTIVTKRLDVDAFLTKSDDWSYEQEWRMLMPLKRADKTVPALSHAVHLFAVPAEAITGVIFGALMGTAERARILSSLKSPTLKHIKRYQAVLSPREFRVEIVPFKPSATPRKRIAAKPRTPRNLRK
jgi:Protein of unknown function (DUF2971)